MKKITCILLSMIIAVTMGMVLTACGDPEKEAAKEAFEAESTRITEQAEILTAEIEKAENSLAKSKPVLDETVLTTLKDKVAEAKKADFTIPEMASETDEINAQVEKLKGVEPAKLTSELKACEKAVSESRRLYGLLDNPEESYVVERLKTVENVEGVQAATEDTDPNNLIGKNGGYKSYIAFTCPYAQDGYLTGDSLEDGVDGGGVVEIYETADLAKQRNDYLSSFDGGLLAGEVHDVYGTIIIRLSSNMKASEQKEMEEAIFKALTQM